MSHYASTPQAADHTGHTPVAVVGAGAWGTVLASLLARNGHAVRLWAQRPEHATSIRHHGRNLDYLPDLELPSLTPTSNLAAAVTDAVAVFMAVPSRAYRAVCAQLSEVAPDAVVVSCSKGLEIATFKRLTEVVAELMPRAQLAALSGPNLASEIATDKPAATTIASANAELAKSLQRLLQQATFRVYTSDDVAGVEIAGALKNVIALACGISDGLGLGDNTKASIITRGLAEIVRLGTAMGGKVATFYGLAGVGDLVATCASDTSRNHRAGVRLALGTTLAELEASGLTAEGIPTVEALHRNQASAGVELPISNEVYRVIFENKSPHDAIASLMTRAERAE